VLGISLFGYLFRFGGILFDYLRVAPNFFRGMKQEIKELVLK